MNSATPTPRRIRFPIRFKILMGLLTVITIVVSAITFTMANLFHSDKKAYIKDLASLVAVHSAEEANSLLRGYHERLQVFGRVMFDPELPHKDKSNLLQGLFGDFPDFIAVTLYQNGTEQATVYDPKTLERAGITKDDLLKDRNANPLPLTDIENGKPFVMNSTLVNDLPSLTIATPLNEAGVDGIPAVAAAVVRLDQLLEIPLRSSNFEIYIGDNRGNILAHRKPALVLGRTPVDWIPQDSMRLLAPLIQGQTASATLEFKVGDAEMMAGFASVSVSKMLLGVQIQKSTAFLTARELLNNLTNVSLALLMISALLSLFWARQITRPVEILSHAAREVGQGKFEVQVDVSAQDEMGALAGSFNQMTTELQTREQALKHAQAALVQSEKMSAFGQLSAGIAHEVKNPLAGILGYAQLSLRKIEKESPAYKHLTLIEKETRRCKTIIENLMKFARQEKVSTEPIDINQVVADAMTIVDHQLTIHQVKLEKELADNLPKVEASANQIQQVLMNLMINAQQAMDGKPGMVKVGTKALDDGNIEIRVSDSGPGMPEEVRAKIFEPFFTTKPAGKGTGLGLSVSYGIIRDHNGTIRVESELGRGATFIITLPPGKDAGTETAAPEPAVPAA